MGSAIANNSSLLLYEDLSLLLGKRAPFVFDNSGADFTSFSVVELYYALSVSFVSFLSFSVYSLHAGFSNCEGPGEREGKGAMS